MTQPRMLLGGAALALLLVGCCIIQSCRNGTAPSPVVVTRLPPLDPPHVTPAAAVGPARPLASSDSAGPKADPAAAKASSEAASIMVHVVGAVKKPGVYPLAARARLMDAVRAAGGAKAGADLEAVNLAGFVQDGEQIRVPALSERSLPRVAGAVLSRSLQVSRLEGPSRPIRSTARYPLSEATAVVAGSSPPEHGTAAKKMTGVVNLNTAGAAELATLPGVGPKTAEAILAYRQEHGSFQRVEDLLEIRGIGEKKLARMRDWVAVK